MESSDSYFIYQNVLEFPKNVLKDFLLEFRKILSFSRKVNEKIESLIFRMVCINVGFAISFPVEAFQIVPKRYKKELECNCNFRDVHRLLTC